MDDCKALLYGQFDYIYHAALAVDTASGRGQSADAARLPRLKVLVSDYERVGPVSYCPPRQRHSFEPSSRE